MLSFLLMFVSLFVWAYSIPILLLLILFGAPVVLPSFLVGVLATSWLQLVYKEPIITSSIRTFFNNLDYTFWFHSIDRVKIPTTEHHLICSHPHNIFSLGILLSVHFTPNSKTVIAVAPVVFHIPFLGFFAAHLGCIPSSKESIMSALKTTSVILIPGGVPEIVCYEQDILFTERYGMFKLGSPILPVVTTSRHYYVPCAPLYDLRLFIARRYNIPIVFPWIFGYYGTWLPKRIPIRVKVLAVEERTRKDYFQEIKDAMYNK